MRLLSFVHKISAVMQVVVRLSYLSALESHMCVSRLTFIAIGKPFSASTLGANSEPRNVSRFCRELSADKTIVGTPAKLQGTFRRSWQCNRLSTTYVVRNTPGTRYASLAPWNEEIGILNSCDNWPSSVQPSDLKSNNATHCLP